MANFAGDSEYDSSAGNIINPAGIFLGRTTPVGSYEPNGWGLYDMHGNVLELCSTWLADSLPGGRVVDPQGPSTGEYTALCGGAWFHIGSRCRSTSRAITPTLTRGLVDVGFRLVLAPGQ